MEVKENGQRGSETMEADNTDLNLNPNPGSFWLSYRFRLSLLLAIGFAFVFTQRVDLSLAIVCMVKGGDVADTNDTLVTFPNSSASSKPSYNVTGTSKRHGQGDHEFMWDKEMQGLLLGSFFWGYIILQIPGGWFAEKFGGKKVITVGVLLSSAFTVATPWCARWSPYVLMINRGFIGLGQSMIFPAASFLLSKWSPPAERTRIVAIVFGGINLGPALTFTISGVLCDYGFDGGWPTIFYLFGGIGFVWCIFWLWLGHASPSDAKNLSTEEMMYLEQTVTDSKRRSSETSTPWVAMMTSPAAWAVFVGHHCANYGFFMMLAQLPTYMNEVLRFDIKSNGFYSTLPYITHFICLNLSANVIDKILQKKLLTKTCTRKLTVILGFGIPAIIFSVVGLLDHTQQTLAVAVIIACIGTSALQASGIIVNYQDIGGKNGGVLYGVGNFLAAFPGFFAPLITAEVTPNRTREEWMVAFLITAGVCVFGAIVFTIFGKAEVQNWSRSTYDTEENAEPLK